MNEQLWWYVARASGIVAFALVTLSVVWGLALSTRLMGRRPAPKWLLALHRMLAGLAVTFTGVHLAGLVADSYVHFGLADLLVPLASDWKPGAVAWGVTGLYLLIAVECTSLLMRRLSRTAWRRVHQSSWVLFWVSAIHGATAGTDAGHPAYQVGSITAVATVLFLTLVRLLAVRRPVATRRAGASPAPATGTEAVAA